MKYYAGIGSRRTPEVICATMQDIAVQLAELGWTLRSGGAEGADSAFEVGASLAGGEIAIYLPWDGFAGGVSTIFPRYVPFEQLEPSVQARAMDLAARHHPAWNKLSQGARKLHARNGCQILGSDLNTPVEFVLCWTPRGNGNGGTGQALRIAKDKHIPIFDLGKPEAFGEFQRFMYQYAGWWIEERL